MTHGLSKDIRCHYLQITRTDIRPHKLGCQPGDFAYGHFNLPPGFVWVYRVRFWAVQNLFWAGRCPKLGLNPPFTAQNCPKLPKTAQNCLKLPTDYESAKLILGQISNLLSLSFLMLEKNYLVMYLLFKNLYFHILTFIKKIY